VDNFTFKRPAERAERLPKPAKYSFKNQSAMSSKKQLALWQKNAILDEIDSRKHGTKKGRSTDLPSLAQWILDEFSLSVSISTVSRVLASRTQLRQQFYEQGKTESKKRKRIRVSSAAKLNETLVLRCNQQEACNGALTDTLIRQLAWQIIKDKGRNALGLSKEGEGTDPTDGAIKSSGKQVLELPESFNCGDSWLTSFKSEHGFRWRKQHGESNSVSAGNAQEVRVQARAALEEYGFEDADIFNMDETALFWRKFPSGSVTSTKQLAGAKEATNRMTLVLCANSNGRMRFPLLIMAMAEQHQNWRRKPRFHPEQLGLVWRKQSKGWMDSTIFAEWLNGKTASLEGIRGFVGAQAATASARWAVATQGDTELHLKFRTEKGKTKVIDRFFQGIQDKCDKQVMIMYGDADFNASGRGEDGGVPTKSIKRACKRHFFTRRTSEFRTSRSCVFCKESDVTPAGTCGSDRVLCKHCLATTGNQHPIDKDVLGAINIRRSGIAEIKTRPRPIDLRLRPHLRTHSTAADCRE